MTSANRVEPCLKTHQSPRSDVGANGRCSLGSTFAIDDLHCRRIDMHDVREQKSVLSPPLASGSKSRGIELISEESRGKVQAKQKLANWSAAMIDYRHQRWPGILKVRSCPATDLRKT